MSTSEIFVTEYIELAPQEYMELPPQWKSDSQ